MKLRLTFATATAIALVSSAAYAGTNNSVDLFQTIDSTGSSATTTQTNASDSNIGTPDHPVKQDGDGNYLTITQTGQADVGVPLPANNAGTEGAGIVQTGNENYLSIKQGNGLGSGGVANNLVGSVEQSSTGADTAPISTPAAAVNQTTITQKQNDTVNHVSQTWAGGPQNSLTIIQNGASSGNTIESVVQNGSNNTATIKMTAGSGGANGVHGFDSGYTAAGLVAGQANGYLGTAGGSYGTIGQSTITQVGPGNTLSFTANSSDSRFGFSQKSYESAYTNSLTGSDTGMANGVAVYQDGANAAHFTLSGGYNDLGILQGGALNTADAFVSGDNNHVFVGQVEEDPGLGSNNYAKIQTDNGAGSHGDQVFAAVQYASGGGSNSASIRATGTATMSNFVVVGQANVGGSQNTANVTISSDGNNTPTPSYPFVRSFTGDANAASGFAGTIGSAVDGLAGAGTASGLASQLDSSPYNVGTGISDAYLLTPGLMTQLGSGNSLTMNVKAGSDSNLFSTAQLGDSNTINATIQGGDSNELAILQAGDHNSATTNQNGGNNNIGLVQSGSYNVASVTQ